MFTTRPDTVFGATYMVLAPEHPLVDELTTGDWPEGTPAEWTGGAATPFDAVAGYITSAGSMSDLERQVESRQKTGVFLGSYATNPANGAAIPVFIADYVLMGYGTGAIMAVPGQDERDWEFAEVFGLPIVRTVQPPERLGRQGVRRRRSRDQQRLPRRPRHRRTRNAHHRVARAEDSGEGTITYRLRDWLFSRQRYWGEPFPIVYDDTGLPIAVPESALPVLLPEIEDFSPRTFDDDDATSEPEAPLARAQDWVEVRLDLGDGPRTLLARDEHDAAVGRDRVGTSCATSTRRTRTRSSIRRSSGTGWARSGTATPAVSTCTSAVSSTRCCTCSTRASGTRCCSTWDTCRRREPFRRLYNQGYILAAAYTDERGMYVEANAVEERDGGYLYEGKPVTREMGKMGKSLKNGISPDEYYRDYGADTLRLYEMFTGPLDQERPWETRAIVGVHRFLQRLWRLVVDEESGALRVDDRPADDEHAPRAASHDRSGARRHGEPAVQHLDRQAHRAHEPRHREGGGHDTRARSPRRSC